MASGVLPRAGQILYMIRAFPRLASSIIQHTKTTLNMKSRTVPTVRSKCPWRRPTRWLAGASAAWRYGLIQTKTAEMDKFFSGHILLIRSKCSAKAAFFAIRFSDIKTMVPDALRGRVMSIPMLDNGLIRRPPWPRRSHGPVSIRAQASLHDFSDRSPEYAATSNILYLKFIDNSKS